MRAAVKAAPFTARTIEARFERSLNSALRAIGAGFAEFRLMAQSDTLLDAQGLTTPHLDCFRSQESGVFARQKRHDAGNIFGLT